MTSPEMAEAHKALHDNKLFYSLTPELQIATAKAIDMAGLDFGAYYEFGTFKGFNLWFAERYTRSKIVGYNWQFYGFDSFEGMPENDVHPNWAKGNYAASLEEVDGHLRRSRADMTRITLIKCWFDNIPQSVGMAPATVVVIDCDLYESAVEVLKFIGPKLVPGSIILFDDWYAYDADPAKGEQFAWYQYLAEHRDIQYGTLFNFGKYGKTIEITET